MRALSDKEIDLIHGAAESSNTFVFQGEPTTIVNPQSALRALRDNTIGAGLISGAAGGPGASLPAAMMGAVWSAYNIGDHTRVVTPTFTIQEIPPGGDPNEYGDS